MALQARVSELKTAVGTVEDVKRKLANAWRTLTTTFNRQERVRRLERLRDHGHLAEIPSEWQILQASYDMMTGFIMPSNAEFYRHYDQNMYWLQFLRVIDEPSTMMDPTGLAVSSDMLIQHLMHVVHTSAGYDVGLLHMFPGALDELESQLEAYVGGVHPRQTAIADLLEKPDYPERLLAAVRKYREDPVRHWEVTTYETPEGCEELFDFGIERYGTLGRLLNYALTLPKTPWGSVRKVLRSSPELSPKV